MAKPCPSETMVQKEPRVVMAVQVDFKFHALFFHHKSLLWLELVLAPPERNYPDLAGIWAVWDVPAEGVMAAARASGRDDLKIATQDLGKNVAIALAKNELIVGLGAQRPYDQGVTEARLAAGALLGKTAAPYVALAALPVEHANVLDAWKQVYQADAPDDLAGAFEE